MKTSNLIRANGRTLTTLAKRLAFVALWWMAAVTALQAQCPAPPNFATNNVTGSSVNVAWNSVPNAVSYEVVWVPQSGGVPVTQQTSNTSFFISNLQPATPYDVRVRAVCSGGVNSNFSTLSFTTTSSSCAAPASLTASLESTTAIRLVWPTVPAAVSYSISYNITGNPNVQNIIVSDSPFVLENLTAGATYSISIRSNCGSQGGLSGFTSTSFDFNNPGGGGGGSCLTPTGLAAANVTTNAATLNWNIVPGATSYDVSYKRTSDQNFTTLSTASVSATISSLPSNTTYEARVRAVCGSGNTSPFGTSINFTTNSSGTACATPTNFRAEGVTASTATLAWALVPGAVNYEVTFRRAGTLSFTSITTNNLSVVLNNLEQGVTYDIRVRSFCGGETFSQYATSTLQTGGTSGECLTPTNFTALTVTTTTATLSWSPVPNASNYTVSYRRIGETNFITATATGTTFQASNLSPGTPYEARVRTTCQNGLLSTESGQTFTTQTQQFCPPPSGLTVTPSNSSVALASWVGTPAAQAYEVSYRAQGSPNFITFTVTNSNATLNGLSGGFTYEVNVRSICTGNNRSEPIASTFTTTVPATCTVPTNFQSTVITTTSATFTWNQVTGANDYEISYRRVNDVNFLANNTNQTTLTIQGLTPSTSYTVRVRARCANFSEYATVQITTPSIPVNCPTISNLELTNVAETSVTLNWTAVVTAVNYQVSYRITGQTLFTDLTAANPPFTVTGLTGGATYDFVVRTRCGADLLSDAVGVQRQLPGGPCPAPSNLVVNNIAALTANVSWSAAINNTVYEVGFRKSGDPNFTVRTITGASAALSDLDPATTYEVRLRTSCPTGSFSQPLNTTFTTLQGNATNCPTPNNLVATDIAPTSARLTWGSTSTFPRFEISYRRPQDLVFTTRVIEGTTTQITNLAPASNYEVRVKNLCANGAESGFARTTFLTNAGEGVCPSPLNLRATEISFTSTKLVWQDGGAGQQYEISFKRADAAEFGNLANALTTEFTLANLEQGREYQARVRAQCRGAFSDYALISFRMEGQVNNCIAPINLTSVNVTDVSGNLGWNTPNPGVGLFHEVGYRIANPAGEWITRTTSQLFISVTDLQPNTRYQFRVRTTCTAGVLSPYATAEFTTREEGFGCEAPSNLFVTNVLPTGVMITWTRAAGVNTSEVGIRIADSGADYALFTTSQAMYSFGNLRPATRYDIRVRSVCANSSSRALVTFANTLENITCGTPANLTVSNIVGEAALASWNAVPNVSTYTITLQRSGDAVSRSFVVGSNVTNYFLTGLIRNSRYTLNVRAVCGTQASLPATTVFSTEATTFCFPPTRPLANDLTETTALITWDPAGSATFYELSYRREGEINFTGLTTNQTSQRLINLRSGSNYEARIRTYCGNSQSNIATFSFRTPNTSNPCLPPNVLLVSKTSTVATFNWGPVQAGYEIGIRTPGDGVWNTTLQTTPPPFVYSRLAPGTTYEVRVRNLCEGRFSDYSNIVSFITDGNPCITPTITALARSSNSITVGITNASNVYEVSYKETGATNTIRVLATTPGQYTIAGLNNNRTYEIQVRNFCGGAYSEFSNRLVTTASNAPQNCAVPTVQVRNVAARQATLFWDVNMTFYEVNIRNINTNSTVTSYHTVLGSLTLSNLASNTPYEVTMRNICGGSFSEASTAVRFSTPAAREEIQTNLSGQTSETLTMTGLYPNPSNGRFTVSYFSSASMPVSIRMTDMSGKEVLRFTGQSIEGTNELPIEAEGLSAGIYSLQLMQGESLKTMKVSIR